MADVDGLGVGQVAAGEAQQARLVEGVAQPWRLGELVEGAGLLQSENQASTDRVPGLGKVPVLGALFSSKAYMRKETDLVIIVTPHLVKPVDPSKKMATPADDEPPMSSADYFLGNVDTMKTSEINKSKIAAGRAPVTRPGHFLDLPKAN